MRRSLLPVSFPVILLVCLFLFLCTAHFAGVCAADDSQSYEQIILGDPNAPWAIRADEVTYYEQDDRYEARGNVVIRQRGRTFYADRVIFDRPAMHISAMGNVMLQVGEDILRARSLQMDVKTEQGVLIDGEVYLAKSNFILKGDRVEQIQPYVFRIEDATVTTCDGDTPAWRITGKNVTVTINGYGFVRHGTLWVKNIPVFYTPFFVFPVMVERQTGLLIPRIGISDRKGFEYDQPLYWAIDPNSDATVYHHYMSERGNKIGLEYRYMLDFDSMGIAMFDYLDDRKIDEGTPDSDAYGYDHDVWDRTNSDRYWFRMKADHYLGNGFDATADLDIVSDQDFLLEFRDGQSGFFNTEDLFFDYFGRDLDGYEDPVRVNQANINKTGLTYSFNSGVRWYDDVIARRHLDEDTTVQNLPRVLFSTSKKPIRDSSLYWRSDSEYTYLFSENGTRGHRLDIHPRLYLPGFYHSYFSVEPSVGLRETVWHVDELDESPLETGEQGIGFRHLIEANIEARSEMYRIHTIDSEHIDSVKHSIIPRVVYRYIPDVDQDEHPWFDGLEDDVNRVKQTNQIGVGITQFLTGRTRPVTRPNGAGRDADLGPEAGGFRYLPLMRLDVMQGYDFHEAAEDNPADFRNGEDRRPFLPLDVELEFMYPEVLSVQSDLKWDHYDHRFVSRNVELRLADDRGDRLGLNYRFTDELVEYISANIGITLTDSLFAYADYQRNLMEGDVVETMVGIIYNAQCWVLDVRVSDEEDDRKIAFMVTLKGLGEIGAR
ncbi:MAG: LPS assembly protein LptD [Desulfobacterales bacterium]